MLLVQNFTVGLGEENFSFICDSNCILAEIWL